jgi:hypothetical protein
MALNKYASVKSGRWLAIFQATCYLYLQGSVSDLPSIYRDFPRPAIT